MVGDMFKAGKVIEHRIDAAMVKCLIETVKIQTQPNTAIATVKYRLRPVKGGKAFWTQPNILAW
jgi:hypothetical protein